MYSHIESRYATVSLPIAILASALSGIAGYAFGAYPTLAAFTHREPKQAALAARAPSNRDDDVLATPLSWSRWPTLVDF